MSKRFAIAPIAGVFLFWLIAATSATADEGWSMSSLNPFKKASTDKRARMSYSDETAKPATSSWLPQSRPSSPLRSSKPAKKEPSTLDKMSQGTKSFFGKTKDVLMPWSKSPSKTDSFKSRKPPKKSLFSSWFPEKKEKQKSRTINDFLAQDRPG